MELVKNLESDHREVERQRRMCRDAGVRGVTKNAAVA
jgi:hypothetical protein